MRYTSISLLVVTCALMSCAPLPTAVVSPEEELRTLLVGKWCLRDEEGKSCRSHEEILANGTIKACGIAEDLPYLMEVVANYRISGRSVCFQVTHTNDPVLFVGYEFCSDVVSVNQSEYRYRLSGEVTEEVMHRLPANAPACPQR